MPISDNFGNFGNFGKYPMAHERYDHKEYLRQKKERERIEFLKERKKKLELFKEQELIRQIDIQYRRKKLEAINNLL